MSHIFHRYQLKEDEENTMDIHLREKKYFREEKKKKQIHYKLP